ncbi:MAG: phosphoglycerate mutase family protein, partial [Oscillospiraceae bacterium]
MKNYRLYLIRHGITQGNLCGKYIGGGTNEPLCEEGIKRLHELQDKYTYPQVNTVFASPLDRAVQTAEI